jgi:putative endonuclease
MPRSRDRRQAEIRGHRAEWLARWLLRLKGYRILAADYRVPVGEIDIVARRGAVLVAAEVKIRSDADAAAWSIGPRQRRRIERAVEHFLKTRPDLAACAIRFDAILVGPWHRLRHVRGAWTAG